PVGCRLQWARSPGEPAAGSLYPGAVAQGREDPGDPSRPVEPASGPWPSPEQAGLLRSPALLAVQPVLVGRWRRVLPDGPPSRRLEPVDGREGLLVPRIRDDLVEAVGGPVPDGPDVGELPDPCDKLPHEEI